MELRILGIGGFGNPGLPFNTYLLDGHVLVDCPPDILQTLARHSIALEEVDTLILTHLHGDHFFGLPFFLFNLRERLLSPGLPETRRARCLRILAPKGSKKAIRDILSLAISPDHPYIDWTESSLKVEEIREGREGRIDLRDGLWLEFARSDHSVPTYSVMAGRQGEENPRFVGTSDTKWSAKTAALLKRPAVLYLCDANGREPGGVHASPQELLEEGSLLVPPEALLLGTHVSALPGLAGPLRFARPGERFIL